MSTGAAMHRAVAGSILAGLLGGPAAAGCLSYEPAVVTLSGTVSIQKAYGPPGFGEDPAHDAREDFPLLTLDHPVCVNANPADPTTENEASVVGLQLVYDLGARFDRRILRQHVNVTGKLMHQMTGHHHTKVLLQVENVRS